MAARGRSNGSGGPSLQEPPSSGDRRDAQSRFRDRSRSNSLSSLSDTGSPKSKDRERNGISRPELLMEDERTLGGKAASAPSMSMMRSAPDVSGFTTPRHPTGGALSFASPDGGRNNGTASTASTAAADGEIASSQANGTNTDGTTDHAAAAGAAADDPSKGGIRRGFKRMLQGVPSPSHFRRSMSFQGSLSAISNAANRVATGAMTPIRRRRHRRENSRESNEGGGGVGGAEAPPSATSVSSRSDATTAAVAGSYETPVSRRSGRIGRSVSRSRLRSGSSSSSNNAGGSGATGDGDGVHLPGGKKHRRGKTEPGGATGVRGLVEQAGIVVDGGAAAQPQQLPTSSPRSSPSQSGIGGVLRRGRSSSKRSSFRTRERGSSFSSNNRDKSREQSSVGSNEGKASPSETSTAAADTAPSVGGRQSSPVSTAPADKSSNAGMISAAPTATASVGCDIKNGARSTAGDAAPRTAGGSVVGATAVSQEEGISGAGVIVDAGAQKRGEKQRHGSGGREEREYSSSSSSSTARFGGSGGIAWRDEDGRGKPPSHDARKTRIRRSSSFGTGPDRAPRESPRPPPPGAGRGITISVPSPRSSSSSDPPASFPPKQRQPLSSTSDDNASVTAAAAAGKGSRPLIARGRSFFGTTGSGGATQMFASSPNGARAAAMRARSLHRKSGSASSVWSTSPRAAEEDLKGQVGTGKLPGSGERAGDDGADGDGAGAVAGATGSAAGAATAAAAAAGAAATAAAAAAAGDSDDAAATKTRGTEAKEKEVAAEIDDGKSAATDGAAAATATAAAAATSPVRGGTEVVLLSDKLPTTTLPSFQDASLSRKLPVHRSNSSGSLVNGHRSPVPLSYVPPAPTPPLLSGTLSGRGFGRSRGGINTWSPISSEAANESETSSGGMGFLSPELVLARASLRRVSPGQAGGSETVGEAKSGKAKWVSNSASSRDGCSSSISFSSSSSSSGGGGGHRQHGLASSEDRKLDGGGRASPDSSNSDSSSGGHREESWRRQAGSQSLKLEERRAALIAASRRTSSGPPPPPPRLLSQASWELNGDAGGAGGGSSEATLIRPTPKKVLARSKTTVGETSSSSQAARVAAAAAFLRGRHSGSFDDAPSVVVPLQPELRARQQQQQQQQHEVGQKNDEEEAAAAAAGSKTPKQQQTTVWSSPPTSSSTPPVQPQPLQKPDAAPPAPLVTTVDQASSPLPVGATTSPSASSCDGGAGSATSVSSSSSRRFRTQGGTRSSSAAVAVKEGDVSPRKNNDDGSVRSLVPGPRLVPSTSFDAEPRKPAPQQGEGGSAAAARVEKPGGRNADGGGGGGDSAVAAAGAVLRWKGGKVVDGRSAQGAADDVPPAEMGALGVLLVCSMCGTKEKGGASRADDGGRGERMAGVEVTRCSRCRKGCCEACFKQLPVHCRGPHVVAPVCRSCFRGVDFENRWHDHLLATSRQRGSYLLPNEDGLRRREHSGAASPAVDTACGSPGDSPLRASPRGGNRNDGGGRASGKATTAVVAVKAARSAELKPSTSLLRASTRLFRRSLSSNGVLSGGDSEPSSPEVGRRSGGIDGAPSTRGRASPPLELFKTVSSFPVGGGSSSRPLSLPQQGKSLQETAAESTTTTPVSTMSWFGSSIGSAFSSLGGYAGGSTASTVSSGMVPRLTSGVSPKEEALMTTPPSARLTPASPPTPSSLTLTEQRQAESRPVSGETTSSSSGAAAATRTPWATARAPMTTILGDASLPAGSVDGARGGKSRQVVSGEGRWSPVKHHHASRSGREPTECPCGAAALYREVIEMGGGQGVAMTAATVVAGGEAVGAAEAAAEVEAKARAAHKMLRAKAYAHLLTRATKALSYARLQGESFKFLRDRGIAAKSEEALLSLKSKAARLSRERHHPLPLPPLGALGDLPSPSAKITTTAAAAAAAAAPAPAPPESTAPARPPEEAKAVVRYTTNPDSSSSSNSNSNGEKSRSPPGVTWILSHSATGGGGGVSSVGNGGSPSTTRVAGGGGSALAGSSVGLGSLPPQGVPVSTTTVMASFAGEGTGAGEVAGDVATTTAAATSGPPPPLRSPPPQEIKATRFPKTDGYKAVLSSGAPSPIRLVRPRDYSVGGAAAAAVQAKGRPRGDGGEKKEQERRGPDSGQGKQAEEDEQEESTALEWVRSERRKLDQMVNSLRRARDLNARKATPNNQQPQQQQQQQTQPRRRRRRFSNGVLDDYDDDDEEVFTSGEEGDADDIGHAADNSAAARRDSLLTLRDGGVSGSRRSGGGGSGSSHGSRRSGGGGGGRSSRETSSSITEHGGSRGDGDSRSSRRRSRDELGSGSGSGSGGRRRGRSGSSDGRSGSRKSGRREGSSNVYGGGGGEGHSKRRERSNQKTRNQSPEGRVGGGTNGEQRLRRGAGRRPSSASSSGSGTTSNNSHRSPAGGRGSGIPEVDDDNLAFSPLGVPAASAVVGSLAAEMAIRGLGGLGGGGGGGGKRVRGGASATTMPSAFGDASAEEMVKLVQDREALFENMISGPGIAATKFPRRGRPRTVVLTLVLPKTTSGSGSNNGGGNSSSGGTSRSGISPASSAGGGSDGRPQRNAAAESAMRPSPSSFRRRGVATLARATSNLFEAAGGKGGGGNSPRSSSLRSTQSLRSLQPKTQQQQQQRGTRSLQSLLDLELVWNRQRGGKGSLRLGEVIEALAGIESQVLRPVCEELRKRAIRSGEFCGEGEWGGVEEDTFVSLRTSRRSLDLKFSTVLIRNRFMLAFKTLVWEAAAEAEADNSKRNGNPTPQQST